MRQTISFVTLGVADLARSRAFYGALGWRESAGSQDSVAFYSAGTVAFALFQRESLAADAGISPSGTGFPRFTLAHNVASSTEVETTINEAVNAGGQRVLKPETAPWGGFRGYFADPDGFLWEVCWNPFFPLDENGFVQLPE